MRKRNHKKLILFLLVFAFAFWMPGCNGPAPVPPDPDVFYEIPEMKTASFHPEAAEGNEEVQIDLSCVHEGYIAVHAESDARMKLQVILGEETYTYNLQQGRDEIFPLQCGNGTYVFRIMKNIEDTKYYEFYRAEAAVNLEDEFDPFLRPNQYADFYEGRECVSIARSLAEQSHTDVEFIGKVYEYVCDTITYDDEKAQDAVDGKLTGYVPDPDRTLAEKKGICFDYACLAASMLRSQGIPTKIIFGYVAPDDLYHAWNMFYTEEGGWVTVKFSAPGDEWTRIDLTFSANGASNKFIGDGSNYMDVYQY